MVSSTGISTLVAERKRKAATTKTRRRLALFGKRMLLGIIAVALVSVFSSGGECRSSLAVHSRFHQHMLRS